MSFWSKIVKFGAVTVLTFDVLWFLRLVGARIATKFWKPRLKPMEESRVYSICTTHDLDFMGHMNNARYFRELDFGRFDFWFRSGLTNFVRIYSSTYVVQHACTIRYRRPINFLRPYVIKTRIIWWDSKSLYFEQQLVTLHDGFIRAIAISKNTIVNANVESIMKEIFAKEELSYAKPEMREDLVTWIDYNQKNSDLLWKEISSNTDGKSDKNMTSMRSFCVSPAPNERDNFNQVAQSVNSSRNLLKPC